VVDSGESQTAAALPAVEAEVAHAPADAPPPKARPTLRVIK